MKTFELIPLIAQANNDITHFLLRMYKPGLDPFRDRKGDFLYEWISVDRVFELEALIEGFEREGFMVGFTSVIMTERGIQSLLMLDFSIPQSDAAEVELVEKISTYQKSGDAPYDMQGWLIRTDSSYHYLGRYAASTDNFRHFLGSALLFRHSDQDHFVTDDRWLGHTLKKGYGTIRIGTKNGGAYPEGVAEIS